ncbi:hypothetical protein [Bradyrhizobium sp. SRS-191]|uniref:hypothetical protein n=1 Tax=Bradyrhizobium sp. SRS-191 TaxID=2962606 RepID=UPI00211F4383|nr:hypothetical protein [Bradyrhizobium sp. SRS-191]
MPKNTYQEGTLLRDVVDRIGNIVRPPIPEKGNADGITASERLSDCDRQLHDGAYDGSVYLRLG